MPRRSPRVAPILRIRPVQCPKRHRLRSRPCLEKRSRDGLSLARVVRSNVNLSLEPFADQEAECGEAEQAKFPRLLIGDAGGLFRGAFGKGDALRERKSNSVRVCSAE